MNKLIRFLNANNYNFLRGKDKDGLPYLIVINYKYNCEKLENELNNYCFYRVEHCEYFCYYVYF